MSFRISPLMIAAVALVFSAVPGFSQGGAFEQGKVTDADGKIVAGAQITFQNADNGNKISAKSDKKGHYIASMLEGNYIVSVTVDGTLRLQLRHTVDTSDGPLDLKFQAPGQAAAAAPGDVQGAGQSKEDAEKAKAREAQLSKNKELNDSFAAGKAAIENKQWDEAITQLTKASGLGPTQPAVWASLAEAYNGSAKAAKSADAGPIYDKEFAAFDKLIELTPADAGAYNNYALALAADGKMDDAKAKLAKAVELDPPGAGKYYYNLGALLMNTNQPDAALDEFKKAIAADPNYAEAYYYLGSTLVGKSTLDQSTGKMVAPPGTIEALQKYLQLKPDGPNAQPAKEMIAALGSSVTTNYKDPSAPAKSKKK